MINEAIKQTIKQNIKEHKTIITFVVMFCIAIIGAITGMIQSHINSNTLWIVGDENRKEDMLFKIIEQLSRNANRQLEQKQQINKKIADGMIDLWYKNQQIISVCKKHNNNDISKELFIKKREQYEEERWDSRVALIKSYDNINNLLGKDFVVKLTSFTAWDEHIVDLCANEAGAALKVWSEKEHDILTSMDNQIVELQDSLLFERLAEAARQNLKFIISDGKRNKVII